ncbi:MAG: FMN-binding protein [Planctomycetota bacterium]|nr:MAG: FMN-binding protein [Planctomycetota bacterium]
MKYLFRSPLFILLILCCLAAGKLKHVHLQPEEFIKSHVKNKKEASKSLWLNKELKKKIGKILGRPFKTLRIRYWSHEKKTIWVLSEIGKTEPITFGFVIKDKKIEVAKVLIFRESRGGEIHNEFFTKQFLSCKLTKKKKLTKKIDGITGATLSVNAMKKTARLALFLDQLNLQSKK